MGDAARQRVMADDAVARLLATHLGDCETGWSMGTFGAIGEFTREPREATASSMHGTSMSLVTARGGLRLKSCQDFRLIASESLTKDSWSQKVALCLPDSHCAMNERRALTEIGPDHDALRADDRGGILFDLGLGCLQVDVCVRIPDTATINALRAVCGQPVFAPKSPALPILMAANPHRVFFTRLGRLEVFQPIPPPDGRSPDGPHTHILPKLLAAGRTHAATEPLPDGWIPCAHFYPAHPQRDQFGRPRAFAQHWHRAFQDLLARYGAADLAELKRDVIARVTAGERPATIAGLDDRHGRAALRITLRQMQTSAPTPSALRNWLAAYDHRGTDDAVDPMEQLH